MPQGGTRSLKRKILGFLQGDDFQNSLSLFVKMPGRQVINPLFSLLYHPDPVVKWRTVTAMGMVLEKLAHTNLEGARVVMRRLMWSLNDESGAIGWGAPEVMGEAMARSEILANEYAAIFGSYADEAGNFLEHVPLQRGLLWGWVRLSLVRPEKLRQWRRHLVKYLLSEDPCVRGHAAQAVGLLTVHEALPLLTDLCNDPADFETFQAEKVTRHKVSDAAREAVGVFEVSDPCGPQHVASK
ncbi:MAG: hypothetical protein QG577_2478 [Thermodesulfobacteriota bacterium]|nr:hypothetical protein [Thermodesulfobacteriota bacterium]